MKVSLWRRENVWLLLDCVELVSHPFYISKQKALIEREFSFRMTITEHGKMIDEDVSAILPANKYISNNIGTGEKYKK